MLVVCVSLYLSMKNDHFNLYRLCIGIVIGYLIEIGLISQYLRRISSTQFSYFLQGLSLPNETLYETLSRHLQTAAAIPTQAHFIYDIYSIIMSFGLSFMPSWEPKAAIPLPAAAVVPIALPAAAVQPPPLPL